MNKINNIVISSRVRLARNAENYPFVINDERANLVARKVIDALSALDDFGVYRMSTMSNGIDGLVLKEKHLISNELLENEKYGVAIINAGETVSIMINEEDHIRMQCITSGFSLMEAYKQISIIDDKISKEITFSFDNKLGYLTRCLTNLGTGLRASAMLFLPGLTLTSTMTEIFQKIMRLNMTIRGVYGEGSGAEGCLYQISNQKTLGITEEQTIQSVKVCIEQIIEAELEARERIIKLEPDELKDQILRSYGKLMNSYKMSVSEFMNLISFVKLGAYYKMLDISDSERLEKLVTDVQPANLCNIFGKEMDARERDIFRSQFVYKIMKSISKRT